MSDRASRRIAAALRREFDEAFARPLELRAVAREELLLVRAGEGELCLRSSEVAGILRCPTLTPLPGGHPALCGLAGVRGSLVAVYVLARLLGLGRDGQRPGWIALCGGERSVALAFDELVGQVRIPRADILTAPSTGGSEVVSVAGTQRTVVSMAAVLGIVLEGERAGD